MTATTTPTSEPSRAAVVPVLVTTALVVLMQLYVSIPLTASVATEFGARGATEALASGYALCYAAGFLVHGPLSDHVGRRPVLVGGLVVLAAATLAVGLAPSLGVVGWLRALQGFAAATFAPTALAYLGESLPPSRRAPAIGAMSVAFLIAGIIGQVAAAEVASRWGWRWVFLASAALLAVLGVVTATAMGPTTRTAGETSLPGRYRDLALFVARPSSLLLALGHLMVLGGFVALYTLLGPHLHSLGLTSGQITGVRAAGLPAMFLSLAAGRVARRVGPATTAVIAYCLASTGLLGVAATSHSVSLLTGSTVIFVAGIALAVPTLITLWGEASAPRRGIGMALNGFVLFLGASLGPYAPRLGTGLARPLVILAAGYIVAALLVHTASRVTHRRIAHTTA